VPLVSGSTGGPALGHGGQDPGLTTIHRVLAYLTHRSRAATWTSALLVRNHSEMRPEDMSNFLGMSAQVIPVLVLIIVIETRWYPKRYDNLRQLAALDRDSAKSLPGMVQRVRAAFADSEGNREALIDQWENAGLPRQFAIDLLGWVDNKSRYRVHLARLRLRSFTSEIRSAAFGFVIPYALMCELLALFGIVTPTSWALETFVFLISIALFALVLIAVDALVFVGRGEDDEPEREA
jgi:hypothetical protein